MKRLILPVFAFTLFFVAACGNTEQKDSVEVAEEKNEQKSETQQGGEKMEEGQEFLVEAASGGLMEVQLGELAAKNAASADVKEFGRMMVTDHGKANAELKTLAAGKNITVPPSPRAEHQEHIDKLQSKKGADFDRSYIAMMVEDHQEDVEKFEQAANNAADPQIKAFAAKQVPILRQHLQRAQAINERLKTSDR